MDTGADKDEKWPRAWYEEVMDGARDRWMREQIRKGRMRRRTLMEEGENEDGRGRWRWFVRFLDDGDEDEDDGDGE